MGQPKNVSLHLDRLQDVVGLGVRRASSFMALGLRVSADQTVNNVTLDSNFQVSFMPLELPLEKVREVQKNFATWVIGNGLRELDQFTSIFTDKLYEMRTLVQFHNQEIDQAAIKRIRDFKARTNVANKLQAIADEFAIDEPVRTHMAGLTKARNALTHNMGVVDEHHTTHDGELQVSWIGHEFAVGDRVIAGPFEPFKVEKGEVIKASFPVRKRTFKIGEPIEFSAHELSEICWTYLQVAERTTKAFETQLRNLGIPGPWRE